MADNKVLIELEIIGNAAKKIAELTESAKDLENQFKNGFGGAGRAFEVFKGVVLERGLEKGLELAKEAAHELFDVFIKEGVQAAIAEENAIASLNGTLAANGNFSKQASKDLIAFADELEKTTKFSNEAVIGAASLLEGLTKLDANGLKKATQGAADLAALFNTDLNSAAQAIGLGFEGSTRGLRRFGIEIAQTTDKSAIASQILTALAAKQGAAQAQADTYSGAVAKLSNSFEGFTKQIGLAIVQNPTLTELVKKSAEIFEELKTKLEGNKEAISRFISDGIGLFLASLPIAISLSTIFAKTILYIVDAFQFLANIVVGSVRVLNEFAHAIDLISGSAENIKKSDDAQKSLVATQESLQYSMSKTSAQLKDIDSYSSTLSETVTKLSESITGAHDPADKLTEKLTTQSAAVVKLTEDQTKLIAQGVAEANQLSTVEAGIEAKTALLDAQHDSELISDQAFYDQKKSQADASYVQQQEALTAALQNKSITEDQYYKSSINLKAKKDAADLQSQKTLNDSKLKDQANFLNTAATLQNAKTKELQIVGKAAAITSLAIQTPPAVGGAIRFGNEIGGPAVGAVFAAITAAAMAAQAAQIAGVPLATGIDSVPGTGNKDNFPAILMPGERVVPTTTNKDLTAFLSGSGTIAQTLQSIDNKLSQLQNQTIVNIGAKNIVNELRDAMAGGRVINV